MARENASLREGLERMREEQERRTQALEQQAQSLREENSSLRQAAENAAPRGQALERENALLQESLERLREEARQGARAVRAAQESSMENQALQERLARLTQELEKARGQEPPPKAREEKGPRHLPHGRRNPLRWEEQLELEGFQSYFALEGDSFAPGEQTVTAPAIGQED